jgi:hypothetical protein
MTRSFFRIQQDLVQIIDRSTQKEPSVDEAHALNIELLKIIRFAQSKSMQELIDVAVDLSNWLDDGDIRQRDADYSEITTKKLKQWADNNRYPAKIIGT